MPVSVKCLECGKDFKVNNSRKDKAKYCSYECANKARSKTVGEWITKTCPSCNKEFTVLKSKNRKYCCKQCQHDKFEKYTKYNCDVCGKEFTLRKSRLQKLLSGKQKSLTCSIECASVNKHTGTNIICDNCGKEFYRRQDHIDRNSAHSFCCNECQYEFSRKISREIRKCEICGESFECKISSNQNCCNQNCFAKWQQEHLISDTSDCENEFDPMLPNGRILIQMLEQRQCDWVETEPQLKVNSLLDELGINYQREKSYTYYAVDNYLIEYNLIIEVQGDYWHCNPILYPLNINKTQLKKISCDKRKKTYILKYYNINILYLWESDIIHSIDKCKALIQAYINNDGVLDNYQSFNYIYENEKLILNKDIIIPYQELDKSAYQQYVK